MATILRGFLGNSSRDELTDEMREILDAIRQERSQCESLVRNAESMLDRVQHVGEPLAKAATDVDAVTTRLAALDGQLARAERIGELYQTLDEGAERLGQNQRKLEAKLAHAGSDAERTRTLLEDLTRKLDQATDLRDQIVPFLEMESPFQELRSEADGLRKQIGGVGDQLARLLEQHGRVADTQNVTTSRIEAIERRHEDFSRTLHEKERRVAEVEQAVRELDGVQSTADDVKRSLDTLKALGDTVTQKSSALQAQQEIIERTIARADALDYAIRKLDDGARKQQETAKSLAALKEGFAGLQSLHDLVTQRATESRQLQQESDEQIRQMRAELGAAREDVGKAVERFDFEGRGLELASQRVADLRAALSDFETRFATMADSGQAVEALHGRTQALAVRLEAIATDVSRLDVESGRIATLRRELDDTARTSRDTVERVTRIEASRPAVEAALRDLEQLQGTHALVKDTLEQMRIAASELARFRSEQSDTRGWLEAVNGSVVELQERIADVLRSAPTVATVQKQVQWVTEGTAAIESRREFVEEMHRRLTELGSLSSALDERGRDLGARMDGAEQRFVGLGAQAGEAERLGKSIASLVSSVQQAGRQSAEIAKNVTGLEARCESVETLAERTRTLRQEIEQRQQAVEEAAKELQKASELRQEAAAAAQQLGERSNKLSDALASAERQTAHVEELAARLEDRVSGLQFFEKRIGQFEDRLAAWERVEQEIARSLEQLTVRQGTIESLQADIDRMFVLAEKTTADVRAIAAAQQEIRENRGSLDGVVSQLREVREMTTALEERKRDMARAEARLSRAEALLVDVRSSLSVIQAQKVIIDHAVEKAGSLQFLLRQAEATVEGLREERELTARVRAASDRGDEATG